MRALLFSPAHYTLDGHQLPRPARRGGPTRSRPPGVVARGPFPARSHRHGGPVEGPRDRGARVDPEPLRAAGRVSLRLPARGAGNRSRPRRRATTRCAPTSSWRSPSAPSTTLPCRAASSTHAPSCWCPAPSAASPDRPVDPPLEVWHNGGPARDPRHPYRGSYEGDEGHGGASRPTTTERPGPGRSPSMPKPGCGSTAESGRETALAWLATGARLAETGCVGHIPEVLDGDAPHRQRGCDAQAWGVSELAARLARPRRPVKPCGGGGTATGRASCSRHTLVVTKVPGACAIVDLYLWR